MLLARRPSPMFFDVHANLFLFRYFYLCSPQSSQAGRGAGARSQRLSNPGRPEDSRQADAQPRGETAHVHETDHSSAAQMNATSSSRTQETGPGAYVVRHVPEFFLFFINIMNYYLSIHILNKNGL